VGSARCGHWRRWGSGLPAHEEDVVDDVEEDSRHLPTGMRSGREHGSPPARTQVSLAHFQQIQPLPGAAEKQGAPMLRECKDASGTQKRTGAATSAPKARGIHTVQHQSLPAKGGHGRECGSGDTQRPATDHDVFGRANGFERPRPTDDWQPASRKGRVP
jgi:hypothetical protein